MKSVRIPKPAGMQHPQLRKCIIAGEQISLVLQTDRERTAKTSQYSPSVVSKHLQAAVNWLLKSTGLCDCWPADVFRIHSHSSLYSKCSSAIPSDWLQLNAILVNIGFYITHKTQHYLLAYPRFFLNISVEYGS